MSWKTQRGKNQHVLRGTVASVLPEASAPLPSDLAGCLWPPVAGGCTSERVLRGACELHPVFSMGAHRLALRLHISVFLQLGDSSDRWASGLSRSPVGQSRRSWMGWMSCHGGEGCHWGGELQWHLWDRAECGPVRRRWPEGAMAGARTRVLHAFRSRRFSLRFLPPPLRAHLKAKATATGSYP